MRVGLEWLGEHADIPPGTTAEAILASLVRVGLEEEAIHRAQIAGPVVVGRVVTEVPEPQKNGKTIHWCQVDVGSFNVGGDDGDGQPRGIVCGAHNFGPGDLVVVSLPGAVLAGGFEIAARRTYGHVSDGMICSARELGIGDDHDGIIRLVELGLGDAVPGQDAIDLLGLAGDTIEVNVTPDRGYALSVRGIAREYSHATGVVFTDPATAEVPEPTADGFAVLVDDRSPVRGRPGCDRFAARVVRGLDATRPSPRWMQRRLEACGMRPIGLAVDVTNYVMLAVGQPLHAYDIGVVTAPITVRRAEAGETLRTLDGVQRGLDPDDLLITDAGGGAASDGRILGLAGVMGGAQGEVSAATTDLLVEAAHFDPISIARASRRHGLSTEASRRFERGVDPALGPVAAELAVRLLVEHGGPDVTVGPVTDLDLRTPVEAIEMSASFPGSVVGLDYRADEVVDTLQIIGCTVGVTGDRLSVGPPSWRPDLRVPVDLAEEVARLRGYDAIGSVLPTPPPGRGLTLAQQARRSVARSLAEHDLVEVLSYPFVSPTVHDAFGLDADDPRRHAVRLANPLSAVAPEMRTSVLAPLLDALRRNVSRGTTDIGLFEIGLVVRPTPGAPAAQRLPVDRRPTADELAALGAAVPDQPPRAAVVITGDRELPGWQGPRRAADWTDALAAVQVVAATLGVEVQITPDQHAPWHPGRCARVTVGGRLAGHAGELHPAVLAALELPPRTVAAEVDLDVLVAASPAVRPATPISAFPVAKEDVALVVADTVAVGDVAAALREGAGELLESVRLFDVFTGSQVGEGHKSLAFALRLRAPDRTLTAAELAATRQAAVDRAAELTGAVLRSA